MTVEDIAKSAVPTTDEILVEFANYYSDSSWFYLWLASFVFIYSKKMSIFFYIIYLVIFTISVNVRIIKENSNEDSKCEKITDSQDLLFNKVNSIALGVGILNIIIVFGFSSYMNISNIFSPSQIVKSSSIKLITGLSTTTTSKLCVS